MSMPDLDCDCSMADYIPFPLSPSPEQKPYIPVSVHDDNRGGHNSHPAEDNGHSRYHDPHYEQAENDNYTSPPEPNSSLPDATPRFESIIQSGHVHKPSNRIIIYPFPADIAPADLRELMQSTIGPVRAVTMICVSAKEAAAELWSLRNDAWRARQKCGWTILCHWVMRAALTIRSRSVPNRRWPCLVCVPARAGRDRPSGRVRRGAS